MPLQVTERAITAALRARYDEYNDAESIIVNPDMRKAVAIGLAAALPHLDGGPQMPSDYQVRLDALSVAARWLAGEPDPDSADLLATADSIENWLRGDG
jgi:hypothetical protein